MRKIKYFYIGLLYWFYNSLKSSAAAKDFLYSLSNREEFTKLSVHEEMLADQQRNTAYHKAIFKYVKEGDTVIDIGTGTGILSFFASQNKAKKIYAIDHSNLLKSAETVAKHNDFKNIEFVNTHSKNFKIDSKVDIILHEQIGDFLFDENMVTNVLDIRDRLLKKDGMILPAYFEFFIEPVKIKDNRTVPFIWEQKIYGVDFSCYKDLYTASGNYQKKCSQDASLVDYFLCKPEVLYKCDLHTMKENDLPTELAYKRTITNSGRLDGFIVYFRGAFDNHISFTSGPTENRALNWAFWILRTPRDMFEEGDTISFKLTMNNWIDKTSWKWYYSKE